MMMGIPLKNIGGNILQKISIEKLFCKKTSPASLARAVPSKKRKEKEKEKIK